MDGDSARERMAATDIPEWAQPVIKTCLVLRAHHRRGRQAPRLVRGMCTGSETVNFDGFYQVAAAASAPTQRAAVEKVEQTSKKLTTPARHQQTAPVDRGKGKCICTVIDAAKDATSGLDEAECAETKQPNRNVP